MAQDTEEDDCMDGEESFIDKLKDCMGSDASGVDERTT